MDVRDEILYFDTILMDLLARKQTLPSTPVENLKISSSTCRNIGLKNNNNNNNNNNKTLPIYISVVLALHLSYYYFVITLTAAPFIKCYNVH